MKISQKTLEILKNFSGINNSIFIKKGSRLAVKSFGNTIVGLTPIEDEFPTDFAVIDMSEFLNVVSSFDDPEFEFEERCVKISGDNRTVTYYYGSQAYLESANVIPKRDTLPDLNNIVAAFTLSEHDLNNIRKTAAILRLERIGISKTGVRLFTPNKPTSNEVKFDIPVECQTEDEYQCNIDLLKMIPDTYSVRIQNGDLVVFERTDGLAYVVGLERK